MDRGSHGAPRRPAQTPGQCVTLLKYNEVRLSCVRCRSVATGVSRERDVQHGGAESTDKNRVVTKQPQLLSIRGYTRQEV